MSKLRFHLNGLATALATHGVELKRHQLLDIAASAFGFRNSNVLTAAAKDGALDAPTVTPLCVVDLPTGETIAVVRDPSSGAPFGIDLSFIEHKADDGSQSDPLLVPAPYGHIVDLRVLRDNSLSDMPHLGASTAPGNNPLIYVSVINTQNDPYLFAATSKGEVLDKVVDFCRFLDPQFSAEFPAGPTFDRANFLDCYFEDNQKEWHYTDAIPLTGGSHQAPVGDEKPIQAKEPERKPLAAPNALAGPQTDATIPLEIYTANIDHRHGQNTYTTLSREELNAQIADYCRESWTEIDASDEPPMDDDEVISTYFDKHANETLTQCAPIVLRVPLGTLAQAIGVAEPDASILLAPPRRTEEPVSAPDTTSAWAEGSKFPLKDWQYDVAMGSTLRSYRSWVADKHQQEAEEAAGLSRPHPVHPTDREFMVLTNGTTEHAWGDSELLDRLGLSYQPDSPWGFYPLTTAEEKYVGEECIVLPNGFMVRLGYSCLYKGQKYLCPTIEVEPEFHTAADAESYVNLIRPTIEKIGGHLLVEEHDENFSSEIRILVPFAWATANGVNFAEYKDSLARLITPSDGARG